MQLHELSPDQGSVKKRKTIGRGNGSGHGTYSGRGMKGQKARAGSKQRAGFEGGRTPLIRQMPKFKGNKSLQQKAEVVNLSDLAKRFTTGGEITKKVLFEAGLISNAAARVKLLGEGAVTAAYQVTIDEYSKQAGEKIAAAGGKVMKPAPKTEKTKEKKSTHSGKEKTT